MERQAAEANQNLKAAAARVQQSRALTQSARAGWFPSLDAGFGPTRERLSPASQLLSDDASGSTQTLWRASGDSLLRGRPVREGGFTSEHSAR
nr:TolC family protein [Pseudomonas sp. SST3]